MNELEKKDEDFGAAAHLILFVVGFVFLIWRAYVAALLWGWFITPLDHKIPAMELGPMLGLILTARLVIPAGLTPPDPKYTKKQNTMFQLGLMVVSPLITLGIAWFVKTLI